MPPDHEGAVLLPCRPAELVNATGAGDAFMAGLAWAYLEGTDLKGTALAGASAAAAIAIEGAGDHQSHSLRGGAPGPDESVTPTLPLTRHVIFTTIWRKLR